VQSQYKGYLLGLVSNLFVASGSVISKVALQNHPVGVVITYWFVWGTLLTGILLWRTKGLKWQSLQTNWALYLAIGGLMGVASVLWFGAMDLVGPSLVAFTTQLTTVFGVLLGRFVLRESISRQEWAGIGLALLGVVVLTYRPTEYLWTGVAMLVVASLAIACHTMLIRRFVGRFGTIEILFYRILVTLGFLLGFFGISGRLSWPSPRLIPVVILGSTVGLVVFNWLRYRALAYIDLSTLSILTTLNPFVVVLLSLLILSQMPNPNQLLGGCLIVLGVILILFNMDATQQE
jgi:drug/metabolite transporter (DMT)-like permease